MFSSLCIWASAADADATVGCLSDQLSAEFAELVSVDDLTEGSPTAQLIIQLPIRYSELELQVIHLQRHEGGRRSLWVGLYFQELEENRSWTSVEIARPDLGNFRFYAQYLSDAGGERECTYEFPFTVSPSKPER